MTAAQLVDHMAAQQIAQGLISQGVDEQVAMQRAQLTVQQQKSEREQNQREAGTRETQRAEQAKRQAVQAELAAFGRAYPEQMKDFPGTLATLTPYLDKGVSLIDAWPLHQIGELQKQVDDLTAKLAAKENAQKAAGASTGSRSGAGGEVKKDPDLSGWED
jgi:cobalamin-dependent methionine synthase I